MRIILIFLSLLSFSPHAQVLRQSTEKSISKVEQLSQKNKFDEGIKTIENAIADPKNTEDDLTQLYGYLGGLYINIDSVKLAREAIEKSLEYLPNAKSPVSKAVAYRFKGLLNSFFNLPDEVVKDAITGLQLIENQEGHLDLKYHLNYLLYATYSGWKDEDKMMQYIKECDKYAQQSGNPNYKANVDLGLSAIYLFRFRENNKVSDLDSNQFYLQKAYKTYQSHPTEVSGSTLVIMMINFANYLLEHSSESLNTRKVEAYKYLKIAETTLEEKRAPFKRWVNIYGIKSEFAMLEGDLETAENYLLEGVKQFEQQNDNSMLRLEHTLYKGLVDISKKKKDYPTAIAYQEKAEEVLKKNFDQLQIFNAQKLEMQYETEKKDQQLKLLTETANLRQTMNYLYGGVALLALLGLGFMFRSYHYKLRYSIEREKKLAKEKEDAEQTAKMQVLLEKEEQARLKAEQDLLELKHQQLQKEALANSLLIEHKNDMLKQIKLKLQAGDAQDINKLLKEEALLNADFEDIRWQISQLHPNFFQRLMEKSNNKLTALDLRYCAYIYLQMSTKQIAQVLHIEAQSVRMFKYRLKQKFELPKESDLEQFLRSIEP